jgi:hypothetical protein
MRNLKSTRDGMVQRGRGGEVRLVHVMGLAGERGGVEGEMVG